MSRPSLPRPTAPSGGRALTVVTVALVFLAAAVPSWAAGSTPDRSAPDVGTPAPSRPPTAMRAAPSSPSSPSRTDPGRSGVLDAVESRRALPLVGRPSTILVLGASFSRELVPALKRAVPRDVRVVDGTRGGVDELPSKGRPRSHAPEWQAAIDRAHPDVVVLTAVTERYLCLPHCASVDLAGDSVRDAARGVGDIPVVWVSLSTTTSRHDGGDWEGVGTRFNARGRRLALDSGGAYVDTVALVPGATLAGPDGLVYRARKADGVHLCPIGTAAVGAAVSQAVTGASRPTRTWWSGPWWDDERVNPFVGLDDATRTCISTPVGGTPSATLPQ